MDSCRREAEMIHCAYCEKPLICDDCLTEYVPPSEEHYRALSQPDILLKCPRCGEILTCHWCKTPYDGVSEEEPD
jgi:RNase P subunit RPR2